MQTVLYAIADSLHLAAAMGWEILWGLILGFTLSAMVDVLVSKAELQKLLPDASPYFVKDEVRFWLTPAVVELPHAERINTALAASLTQKIGPALQPGPSTKLLA